MDNSPAINGKLPPHTRQPISILTRPQNNPVRTFFALAALDIAANAAAGPAAVATAIHLSGAELTARALQLGALAGVTKSGVLAFVEFIAYAGIPTPAWILLMLLASSFGICVLVTAEISNLVLGESMYIHSRDWGWGLSFKFVGKLMRRVLSDSAEWVVDCGCCCCDTIGWGVYWDISV